MVEKSQRIPKVSINYRRKAGTAIQATLFVLADLYNTTPNKVIDLLIMSEYARKVKK